MIDLRRYRVPLVMLTIIIGLVALDLFVGRLQDKAVEARTAHRKANERLAYYLERTTVENISYTGKGNTYEHASAL